MSLACCPVACHASALKYKAKKAAAKKVPVYGKATPGKPMAVTLGKVGGIVLIGSAA